MGVLEHKDECDSACLLLWLEFWGDFLKISNQKMSSGNEHLSLEYTPIKPCHCLSDSDIKHHKVGAAYS